MLPILVVGLGLLAGAPAGAPAPADLAAYQAAQKEVGNDPEAHIRLALWCETHGLEAERRKHLALAVLIDPDNATARGLMGLVSYQGSWRRPDAVLEKVKADEELSARLAEYNGRRARMSDTADGHWKMALWCEENGLKAEAQAHLTAVTRLDPGREAAWLRLGCKKRGGRWVTEEQLAAEDAEAAAQRKADLYWKPLLSKWRVWLGDRSRRARAEEALGAVNDPRAARSVWQVFGREGERNQQRAVEIFGRLDCQASSSALALLATWGSTPGARRAAAEVLRNRDPREYVGFLLALQQQEYRLTPGAVPVDAEHFRRTLTVEGDKLNVGPGSVFRDNRGVDMTVTADFKKVIWNPQRFFTSDVPFNDPLGEWYSYTSAMPGTLGGPMVTPQSAQMVQQMLAQPQNAAPTLANHQAAGQHGHAAHVGVGGGMSSDQQISMFVQNAMAAARYRDAQILWAQTSPLNQSSNFVQHVAYFEEANREIRQSNSEIYASLNMITDQNLAEDPEAWRKWYYDAQGYAYTPPKKKPEKPRIFLNLSMPSCFAAGTPVRTLSGLRPIETVSVGDQVLAQGPDTGKLSFESVNAVHHNPPGETLRVKLGGEDILPSIYHRFWRVGRGWVMARDLKPGDKVRTLGGVVPVNSVAPAGVRKVYNLTVASSHSFFVGNGAALVHDNTLPAIRAAQFDCPADLAVAVSHQDERR